MNPSSVDIKDMIVAAGFGTFQTDLFIGGLPETGNDLCISIMDIGGMSPELNYEWTRPAIQVQVRSKAGGYLDAYTKISAIAGLLHGKQETINGVVYKLIQQEGDISHIHTDEKRRSLWTTRFQIQRTTE